MSVDLAVDADLQFSVDISGSRTVTGVLTGSGKAMELRVSDPILFAGRSDAGAVRGLAKSLAGQGLLLRVIAPSGPLVTLGAAKTSWFQRRVTGSRHIQLERSGSLWLLLRGRSRAPVGGALPLAELAPPPTLFPIAPTMARGAKPPVTTTHSRPGGGNPRLIMGLGRIPSPATGGRCSGCAVMSSPSAAVPTVTSGCRGWRRCTPRSGTTTRTSTWWYESAPLEALG